MPYLSDLVVLGVCLSLPHANIFRKMLRYLVRPKSRSVFQHRYGESIGLLLILRIDKRGSDENRENLSEFFHRNSSALERGLGMGVPLNRDSSHASPGPWVL